MQTGAFSKAAHTRGLGHSHRFRAGNDVVDQYGIAGAARLGIRHADLDRPFPQPALAKDHSRTTDMPGYVRGPLPAFRVGSDNHRRFDVRGYPTRDGRERARGDPPRLAGIACPDACRAGTARQCRPSWHPILALSAPDTRDAEPAGQDRVARRRRRPPAFGVGVQPHVRLAVGKSTSCLNDAKLGRQKCREFGTWKVLLVLPDVSCAAKGYLDASDGLKAGLNLWL